MTKAAELAKMGEVLTNSQIGGRRNIIINGAMQVAQRGTSATGLGASGSYPTVDRFLLAGGSSAGRLTMTQDSSAPSGFANSIKLDCTTADTSIAAGEYLLLQTKLEGQDLQQLKKGTSDAEKVTVSFYVKGNASATYVLELADEDNNRKNTQKFNVTTDWTRVVLTYDGDTTGTLDDDNAGSLLLTIWLHAGSTYSGGTFTSNVWSAMSSANRAVGITSFFDSTDRTFFLTGLQMEIGSQATPFEHRSFGEELELCQRYYFRINPTDSYQRYCYMSYTTATAAEGVLNFPTRMRTEPSFENTGTSTNYAIYIQGNVRAISSSLSIGAASGDDRITLTGNTSSGDTGVVGQFLANNNTSAFIAFSAEL
jgi:hypothetical protein